MNETIRRRLNILLYLAKVDGKFHKAERALIQDFLKEHRVKDIDFDELATPRDLEMDKVTKKEELLFLALRLVNADNHIDQKEIEFCRELAEQFGYKPEFIDEFSTRNLEWPYFKKNIKNWRA